MNVNYKKSIYESIMKSVSKTVKKVLYENEYSNQVYTSFDELSILNKSGNIGDILQVNQFNEYRVKPGNLNINESLFDNDDIDFDDDDELISDKIAEWKDIAICFETGLWVYLDWVGLHKKFKWAKENSSIYKKIPNRDGLKNTKYILTNYSIELQGTIWNAVQNCKYSVYIPDEKQLKIICDNNKKYNLLSFNNEHYWAGCQCAGGEGSYTYAFDVYFNDGYNGYSNKTNEYRSVALLRFK